MVEPVSFDRVAPIVAVRDLDAALARYRRLGFTVEAYAGGERYGFVERGSVTLHLTERADHDPSRTAASLYLYVSDADAVHAEWAATDLEGHLSDPRDTSWGLREFAYVDADGTLHRVGSRLD